MHINIYTHTHIYAYAYACIYKYTHTYTFKYTYTYIDDCSKTCPIYVAICTYTYMCTKIFSLLHLECHFFNLESQSMFYFARSLLPRSVEKRPMRLRLEIEIT